MGHRVTETRRVGVRIPPPDHALRRFEPWASPEWRIRPGSASRQGGASGGENLQGGGTIIGAGGPPQGSDHPGNHDGVRAELAGIFLRAVQLLVAEYGAGVDSEGSRVVGPPPRGAADTEAAVQSTVGIGEDRPGPAEMPGDSGEPVGEAEADCDQTNLWVMMGLLHLDQVLLAWQSMPVA